MCIKRSNCLQELDQLYIKETYTAHPCHRVKIVSLKSGEHPPLLCFSRLLSLLTSDYNVRSQQNRLHDTLQLVSQVLRVIGISDTTVRCMVLGLG